MTTQKPTAPPHPETPAQTAARVRREGSISLRELSKMPDENLKAAVEALRVPRGNR